MMIFVTEIVKMRQNKNATDIFIHRMNIFSNWFFSFENDTFRTRLNHFCRTNKFHGFLLACFDSYTAKRLLFILVHISFIFYMIKWKELEKQMAKIERETTEIRADIIRYQWNAFFSISFCWRARVSTDTDASQRNAFLLFEYQNDELMLSLSSSSSSS